MEAGVTIFERSCAYCGARFRVLAMHTPHVQDHPQEYACPDCGKRYEAECVDEPQVQLLQPRTDGKHDRYQETMF
ncbi:MAG: hypothetical protein HY854_00860 [Burkholderiales bacterium]|nr:hypothetical protein [Burkholderiales bacterium]